MREKAVIILQDVIIKMPNFDREITYHEMRKRRFNINDLELTEQKINILTNHYQHEIDKIKKRSDMLKLCTHIDEIKKYANELQTALDRLEAYQDFIFILQKDNQY